MISEKNENNESFLLILTEMKNNIIIQVTKILKQLVLYVINFVYLKNQILRTYPFLQINFSFVVIRKNNITSHFQIFVV